MSGQLSRYSFPFVFFLGIALALSAWAFTPFSLAPDACKAVAVAVLVIAWWVTEALPMSVVVLVPLVLLPLLGLGGIDEVSKAYANPVIFLFLGGFMIALANALEKAGVMEAVGRGLAGFSHTGPFTLVLVIVVVSIFLSEVMSNVAQVIVLAPVLCALADALHLDPLLLGMPMALAASAASMLPMGTPPNAIVFGSGYIRMKDMIRAGFVINLISIIVIILFTWFFLHPVMRAVN